MGVRKKVGNPQLYVKSSSIQLRLRKEVLHSQLTLRVSGLREPEMAVVALTSCAAPNTKYRMSRSAQPGMPVVKSNSSCAYRPWPQNACAEVEKDVGIILV